MVFFMRVVNEMKSARLAFMHVFKCMNDRIFRNSSNALVVGLVGENKDSALGLLKFVRQGAEESLANGVPPLLQEGDESSCSTVDTKELIATFVANPELTAASLLRFDVLLLVWDHQFDIGFLNDFFLVTYKIPVCCLLLSNSMIPMYDKRIDCLWSTKSSTTIYRLLLRDLPRISMTQFCKGQMFHYNMDTLKKSYRTVVRKALIHVYDVLLKDEMNRELLFGHVKASFIESGLQLLKDKCKEEKMTAKKFAKYVMESKTSLSELVFDLLSLLDLKKVMLLEGFLPLIEFDEIINPSTEAIQSARRIRDNIVQKHSPERWYVALKCGMNWLNCAMPLQRSYLAHHVGFIEAVKDAALRFDLKTRYGTFCAVQSLKWIKTGDLGTEDWNDIAIQALKCSRLDVKNSAQMLIETLNIWNEDEETSLIMEEVNSGIYDYEESNEQEEEQEQKQEQEQENGLDRDEKQQEKKENRLTKRTDLWKTIFYAVMLFLFWKYGRQIYKKFLEFFKN